MIGSCNGDCRMVCGVCMWTVVGVIDGWSRRSKAGRRRCLGPCVELVVVLVVVLVVEAVTEAAEVVVRSLRMLDIERLVLVDVHLELLEQIRGQMDSKREDADAKE